MVRAPVAEEALDPADDPLEIGDRRGVEEAAEDDEAVAGEGLGAQNDDPGSSRNATSSAVLSRPRIALRWGKRPKRAMIVRWRSA